MTFVTVTTTCARGRGALAAALVLAGVAAAIAPWVPAAARSGSSHHGSHRSGSGGQGGAAAPAPPGGPVNWLTSADGTLHTAVGVYSDCTGAAPVPTDMAAVDTCVRGRTYFVGHNQGVFTPLMHLGVGAIITYFDGSGTAHVWRVAYVIPNWTAANGVPPAQGPGVVAQFQTCVVADGSVDRILDVVPA